ncbi:hypothetical protein [Actinomyces procaprae]|uniref:hypothetical protein n=1 Tax=Actinomyces procaprae TaxID=2560010 RepID=UPI00109DC420|nr:hypothetical protein [Actinomyces procaprae]
MADSKANKKNEPTPHSKFYWLLTILGAIIGVVGIIALLAWITSNSSGGARVPRLLLALPLLVSLAVAWMIDATIVEKAPQLVRKKDRALLAAKLGHDPVTGAPLTATYGQAGGYPAPPQPTAPGYGYGQAPAYGAPTTPQPAPASPGYGYGQSPAPQSPAPQSPSQAAPQSYGQMGYGQVPPGQ